MVNFSSLKSVPDLFQSQNLEKAGQFLRQPLALAVLASLGAHALLAVTLPMWSASGEKQPDTKSVSVVELSPLEQARLPQLDLSKPLSPLPKTTGKSRKTESPDALGTIGNLDVPANSPPSDATPLYSIPLTPPAIPFSGLSATSSLPKRSSARKAEPTKAAEEKSASDKQEAEAKQATNPGTSKDEATSNAPSKQASDLKSPEESATGQETEAQKLANLFAFNSENTSEEDFQKNAVNFSNYAIDLSQGDLQQDWKKLDAVKAPYPKQACQFKHDDKAVQGEPWFGVIVKPDGTIAAKPVLLKSSGFKGLDEAAAEFVTKQKFEPGKKYQGLYFPVKLVPSETDCTATTSDKPAS
ncbi:MAG: energy transducer TonB [Leptodesmis sp.]|uniref:energy transducer TonB n=1 Tax=Leptodesmis sp. TaxID=3100501 RepID=UPI003D0AF16A